MLARDQPRQQDAQRQGRSQGRLHHPSPGGGIFRWTRHGGNVTALGEGVAILEGGHSCLPWDSSPPPVARMPPLADSMADRNVRPPVARMPPLADLMADRNVRPPKFRGLPGPVR